MEYVSTQNAEPTSQRKSVRALVNRSLRVPIEKRTAGIRASIDANKARRRRDRDEPHEMVYHKHKIMKL